MYSQQFVRFAEPHLNLSIDEVVVLEAMGPTSDLSSLVRDLSIEWDSDPDGEDQDTKAPKKTASRESFVDANGLRAAWHIRLKARPSPDDSAGPGEILAVVVATRLSVTGHRLALHGWVRPAYRGLGLGHRLFRRAIEELTAAYSGHNLIVDLGPDNPARGGTSIRNVGWLRFYEQLGFTRDRSDPTRFQMARILR